jgi:hypothetical protein
MTRQLVKHSQIGSHWRIVIAIPLLLLLAGTILAATRTVCAYRNESVADVDPLSWQFVGHGLGQWWHCKEFVEFVTKKVVPAIEHRIKVP